jgi:hypothetical protein
MDASGVRGFNYSGSWGTSGLDLWQHHDNGTMAVEVARGKRYFPGWNVARWWLSHEAFQRSPERFLANFDAGLSIFDRHGIRVMPVLFNRWRDPVCDFGGVPLDHLLPGHGVYAPQHGFRSANRETEHPWTVVSLFGDYLGQVVGKHAADERIFSWDLCNEPFIGEYVAEDGPVRQAELDWLSWFYDTCKAVGAAQPITIGNIGHLAALEITDPIVDLISFHPYYIANLEIDWLPLGSAARFEAFLDDAVALAAANGKQLLATETAWGAVDDDERVSIMRYTLGELVRRNIGFLVHALHHSLVADLHASAFGPVTGVGRFEFIAADGSLRNGHDAWNDFAT